MAAKAKRGRGAPSAFRQKYIEQGRKLAELGATDREIAEFFKVKERTIYRWLHAHPEFSQALKVGKDAADDRVEKALYRRAVGYTFDAVKIMQHQGAEVVIPYEEHVPPDVVACIFWLKNRRRAEWRDKIDHDHGGTAGDTYNITMNMPTALPGEDRSYRHGPVIDHQPVESAAE